MAGHRIGDVVERELRRTLLAGEVAEAERTRQPGIARGPVGQHQQVFARCGSGAWSGCRPTCRCRPDAACRLLSAPERPCCGERDLGAEHGGQANGAGRFGEAHDAVEAVVIGERQRLQTQARRFLGQLLGVRGTVEEREVAVAVQLRVRHAPGVGPGRRLRVGFGLERLPLAAERRPVAARIPRWAARRATVSTAIRQARPESSASRSLHGMSGLLKPMDREHIEHMFAQQAGRPDTQSRRSAVVLPHLNAEVRGEAGQGCQR